MSVAEGSKYRVGEYIIDTARYRISHRDTVIPVEPKVFDLLVYLIRHRDRVLTREELFEAVWDGREVSDATLSNHVKSARKVLGDSGELQQTIQTIRGRGYQFIAAVSAEPGETQVQGAQKEQSTPQSPPARSGRPVWLLPLASSIVLLVAVALFGLRYLGTSDASGTSAPGGTAWLVAVPIEVTVADPEVWQPWADELTRRVISQLRQVSGLKVKDRATSFMFGADRTHAYIRRQLPDVRYALEGVLSVSASNVPSVTMELDDLATGEQLWTKSYAYPRSADDTSLAEMQNTITRAVSESLQVILLEGERRALDATGEPRTSNREVLELYVQGWQHMQLVNHEFLKKAITLFDAAIALDPAFFDAYIAKAEAYRIIYAYYDTPRDVFAKVIAPLEKARDLRPDSAEPLGALGLIYAMAWDWEKAWQNLSAAREKNPDLATTNLGFALYYSALGEIELMKKSLYRARDNDSLNLEVADWGNWVLFLTGQIDASREWGNDMMDKHPTIGFVTSDAAIGTYLDGDFKRAVKLAENGRLLDDSPLAKIILAQAYGYAGEKEKVRPLLVEAAQTGVYACPYESAVGYLSIGDVDTAMAMLEQAYQKLSNCLIFLRTDVRLQPIREHPRHRKQYLDLLARVGLDDAKWKSYPR